MRLILLIWVVAVASAMSQTQAEMARTAMAQYGAPDWSAIVDGVQRGTYAFTDVIGLKTYIDFHQFNQAPNSLKNVLHHEIDHLRGRLHNNASFDIMSYRLTVDSNGRVLNDAFVWP